MRFQVPQFIEVEDKIFGPLTFKQFIYVSGSGAFAAMLFATQGVLLALLLGGPVVMAGLALAFYKINSRPFIEVVQSAVTYSTKSKLYLWKKKERPQKKVSATPVAVEKLYVPKLTQNKLKDLAWSLDIKESMYEKESQAR